MAINNFYTIVNISGAILRPTIDDKKISTLKNGEQSTGHQFLSGEEISVNIGGRTISLFLPKGQNSWSTIVFNKNGFINIYPSSPSQHKLSY